MRNVGVHFSINKMLAAECYKNRLESGLTFFELGYMLMQSYDFLYLHDKYGCKLQMGGNDQWSNIIDVYKRQIMYFAIVFIISLPLIIYLMINTFDFEQISILGITIPKLSINRYEEVTTLFSNNIFENCVDNLLDTVRLPIIQYDKFDWNALQDVYKRQMLKLDILYLNYVMKI